MNIFKSYQHYAVTETIILLLGTEISPMLLWWDHAVSPKLSTLDPANTEFCRQLHYDVTRRRRQYVEKMIEINVVYCLFVVIFTHLASRRKIINHHVAVGTWESHPRVQDLQHPRLGKPSRRLQILDTRMGYLRSFRNVVIDSIILLLGTKISWIFLWWDDAITPNLSPNDLTKIEFCHHLYYVVTYTIMSH